MMDEPETFTPPPDKIICSGLMSPTVPGKPPPGSGWKEHRNLWQFRDEVLDMQKREANRNICGILLTPEKIKKELHESEIRPVTPMVRQQPFSSVFG